MVYWCLGCNVPLVESKCGLCGYDGVEVRLFRPEDPRPAFERDREILREALEREFGAFGFEALAVRSVILLNRIPYADAGYEVVGDGVLVGHLFYDLASFRWRFKPLRAGCIRLVEEGVMESVRLDGKPSRGVTVPLRVVDRGFVALIDSDGKVVGVSEQTAEGLRVLNVWKPSWSLAKRVENRAGLAEALKANELAILSEASRASKLIYGAYARFRGSLVVSFSGGKDSLVTLDLALKAGLTPTILFTDTGIELPETVSNTHRVSLRLGLKLLDADAGDAFWKGLKVYGPPARGYRWCCKLCKLIPTAKAYRRFFKDRVLTVVGQRGAESRARRRRGAVWKNMWIPGSLNMSPIMGWRMLHVWLYIFLEKLEGLVNPLYFKGFDRIGCYLCPYCNLAEFHEVRRLHPQLWFRWESLLRGWSTGIGFGEKYVKLALWRWRRTPKAVRRITGVVVEEGLRMALRVKVEKTQPTGEGFIAFIRLDKPINLNRVLELSPTIGGLEKPSDDFLEHREGSMVVKIRKEGLLIEFKSKMVEFKPLAKVLGLTARAMLCTGCLSCLFWCSREAVKLVDGMVTVDVKLCNGCGLCSEKCPAATYFIAEGMPTILRQLCLPQRGSATLI